MGKHYVNTTAFYMRHLSSCGINLVFMEVLDPIFLGVCVNFIPRNNPGNEARRD